MIARLVLTAAVLLAANTAVALPTRNFASTDGTVRLAYAATLKPGHDFSGRSLMTTGWRLMWNGGDPGPGQGIVRFEQLARPKPGTPGSVTEMIQLGMSRAAPAVARCTSYGLGGGKRLPDRLIGGRRWAAYDHSDAGMSQSIHAIDLRAVANGACYAVSRITYGVSAVDTPPPSVPTQARAAAAMDAILASVRITPPRR